MPLYKSQGPYPDSIIKATEIREQVSQKGHSLVFNMDTGQSSPDVQGLTDEGCNDELRVTIPPKESFEDYQNTIRLVAEWIDALPRYEGRPTYVYASFHEGEFLVGELRPDDPLYAELDFFQS